MLYYMLEERAGLFQTFFRAFGFLVAFPPLLLGKISSIPRSSLCFALLNRVLPLSSTYLFCGVRCRQQSSQISISDTKETPSSSQSDPRGRRGHFLSCRSFPSDPEHLRSWQSVLRNPFQMRSTLVRRCRRSWSLP